VGCWGGGREVGRVRQNNLFGILWSWLCAGIGETNDGIGETNAGIGETNDDIRETNAGIGETNDGIGETNAGIGETNDDIGETNAGIGETNDGIGETNAGIGETNAGIGETNACIRETNVGIGIPVSIVFVQYRTQKCLMASPYSGTGPGKAWKVYFILVSDRTECRDVRHLK
jgi:hypothetical protein